MSAATSVNIPVPPQALELVIKGQEGTVAFACPTCGNIYTGHSFGGGVPGEEAGRHAAAGCCHRYCDCGAALEKGWSVCSACRSLIQAGKEKKLFEKAKKVTIEEYPADAMVFWEGDLAIGDGYFLNITELLDRCEEEDVEVPKYVWGCKPVPFSMRMDNLVEQALEGHHEDARDQITGAAEKELQDFLTAWCAKQRVKSWNPDYTVAVLLHPES